MPENTPLSVAVEGDELVIRIGIDTLAFAAEHDDPFNVFDIDRNKFVQAWQISANKGWAEDVAHTLRVEGEDGSTPVSRLLDKMFVEALEQGSSNVYETDSEPLEDEDDRP